MKNISSVFLIYQKTLIALEVKAIITGFTIAVADVANMLYYSFDSRMHTKNFAI